MPPLANSTTRSPPPKKLWQLAGPPTNPKPPKGLPPVWNCIAQATPTINPLAQHVRRISDGRTWLPKRPKMDCVLICRLEGHAPARPFTQCGHAGAWPSKSAGDSFAFCRCAKHVSLPAAEIDRLDERGTIQTMAVGGGNPGRHLACLSARVARRLHLG